MSRHGFGNNPRYHAYHAVFFAQLSFGSGPEQKFSLLADTGSSWTWVDTCHESTATTQCPPFLFNPALSETSACSN